MVVERSHQKNPFSFRKFEIGDLDDDGERLQDKNEPDQEEQDFHLQKNEEIGKACSQGEGTGVPHDDFCGFEIETEEGEDRPQEAERKNHDRFFFPMAAQKNRDSEGDDYQSPRESVQTVA